MHKVAFADEIYERIAKRRPRVHVYEDLRPRKTALLVVDMQTAFVAEGAPSEIPISREIVPNINELASVIRETGGLVVWVVSTYGPDEKDRWPTFFDHMMSPEAGNRFRNALSDGAPGHEIYAGLDYKSGEPVVSKNRFGAFIGSQGELETLLRKNDIDTVLVTGTVTNICCETTAREAAMLSFKTVMVSDGNAGRTDEEHNATLATFLQAMGDVLTTERIVKALKSAPPAGDAS